MFGRRKKDEEFGVDYPSVYGKSITERISSYCPNCIGQNLMLQDEVRAHGFYDKTGKPGLTYDCPDCGAKWNVYGDHSEPRVDQKPKRFRWDPNR